MSSPSMYFAQYLLFWWQQMNRHQQVVIQYEPLVYRSLNPWEQLYLSAWLIHKVLKVVQLSFPFFNFLRGLWCGQSFPSTSSMEYILPESPQHIEWYSLPNGWGLWGTHIQPGQVHWLVHTNMDSSRQIIHEGTKALCVCLLKALTNSSTQWKGALYGGAEVEVNFRYFMMASKRLWEPLQSASSLLLDTPLQSCERL